MGVILLILFIYYVVFGGIYAGIYFANTDVGNTILEVFLDKPFMYLIPGYGVYLLYKDYMGDEA